MLILLGGTGGGSIANTDEAGCGFEPSPDGGGAVGAAAAPLLAPSSSIKYPMINFCKMN
jgi:hypothetical protein